jgi:hypothetical protein
MTWRRDWFRIKERVLFSGKNNYTKGNYLSRYRLGGFNLLGEVECTAPL